MRMKCITSYHLSPILLLLVLETASFAQVPAANKANAKVAGRIILDGKPAVAIQVQKSVARQGSISCSPERFPTPSQGDKSLRLGAWDAAERKELRKEAAASNFVIELKPCQQIVGYAQRLTN